ncbi:MAG TPA: STAS domain-containing protein [Candidatus Binatia bacterium]|nr:STAS domain-containing protein [Candidatus Binatia bacterium]
MKPTAANLSVWISEGEACIRIGGRASFNNSVDFKTLISSLAQNGCSHFILDLTDCLLMDSTFLGVLAGLGIKYPHNGNDHPAFDLLNPNHRIADLLENLGVMHLFHIVRGPSPGRQMQGVEHTAAQDDGTEVARTCLEAHQTLMKVNPHNVPKFRDVAEYLADDLRKKETGQK